MTPPPSLRFLRPREVSVALAALDEAIMLTGPRCAEAVAASL